MYTHSIYLGRDIYTQTEKINDNSKLGNKFFCKKGDLQLFAFKNI